LCGLRRQRKCSHDDIACIFAKDTSPSVNIAERWLRFRADIYKIFSQKDYEQDYRPIVMSDEPNPPQD